MFILCYFEVLAFLLFDFYYYPLEACLFISKGQRGADLEGSWGATKRHGGSETVYGYVV